LDAREADLLNRFNKSTRRANQFRLSEIVSSPSRENISVFQKSKSGYINSHPVPFGGALRNVTSAGRGCGGRGWRS
jgi:hypothetical protein